MSQSFEKSVKGGTKIKLAPPKSKYVDHILRATHAGDAGVAEVFRTMTNRLRDSTWTIVFKGLIIVHMMIRDGAPDVTLKYLAEHPSKLAISTFSDAQDQGRNIRHYYSYIDRRGKAFRDTKIDWVRDGQGRLKRLSVDKGLLRETEVVQKQIAELLRCDLLTDPENEISLTAFRLLVMDLLKLYSVMNEGTINVLEHYFEMSKTDAERALSIYKNFAKQTDEVVQYLSVARTYEGATRLEIPKLKHAPTGLTQSLTEYLNDPDFDINRRQYLAQQEAKRTGKPVKPVDMSNANGSASKASQPSAQPAAATAAAKGPAPDLIDLFGSIENNQQTMATTNQMFPGVPQQQQVFQTGFPQQQQQQQQAGTNPFAAMVQQQTAQQQPMQGNAAGYNPFAPQPQIQTQPTAQPFSPQQTTSPQQFQPTGQNPFGQPQQQQNMQPSLQQPFQTGAPQGQFGQTLTQQSPFGQQPAMANGQQQQQQMNPQMTAAPLQPQQTSTNPFRQSMMAQATGAPSPFNSSPSGGQSTNPFGMGAGQGMPSIQEGSPFSQPPPPQQQQQQQQAQQQQSPFFTGQQQSSPFQSAAPTAQPLQPTQTGSNPFARTASPASNSLSPQSAAPLMPNPTGSTNPFRQSQFVNQQTGQAWQQQPQGTIGGMDVNNFQSLPVFPRPPGQQQQQPWP